MKSDMEMIDLALEGLDASIARVRSAPAAVPRAMYVSLAEAAWWACCVDEAFELRDGYKSRRNNDDDGRVFRGLRYVRSMLGHHRIFTATIGGGLMLPLTIPFKINTYAAWMPTDELPTMEGLQARLRPHYATDLAGKPVIDTLARAQTWLHRERMRDDSQA